MGTVPRCLLLFYPMAAGLSEGGAHEGAPRPRSPSPVTGAGRWTQGSSAGHEGGARGAGAPGQGLGICGQTLRDLSDGSLRAALSHRKGEGFRPNVLPAHVALQPLLFEVALPGGLSGQQGGVSEGQRVPGHPQGSVGAAARRPLLGGR